MSQNSRRSTGLAFYTQADQGQLVMPKKSVTAKQREIIKLNFCKIIFSDEEDWIRTDFDETLPMSSYLLALVVSDFEFVEGHTKRGTRVCLRKF